MYFSRLELSGIEVLEQEKELFSLSGEEIL